jgi:Aminotransferase class I and II
VPAGDHGLEPDAIERAIVEASRVGRVRALYDIPDFNNPLGTSLPLATRGEILRLCHRHQVLLIEDNAYGMFAYDHDRPPTMKALDVHQDVLYIGSFSKTLFPGLRLGYLVANQRVPTTGETLAAALSRVKSLLTVNTPPLIQAMAIAALSQTGGSLEPIVAPKRARYKQQLPRWTAGRVVESAGGRILHDRDTPLLVRSRGVAALRAGLRRDRLPDALLLPRLGPRSADPLVVQRRRTRHHRRRRRTAGRVHSRSGDQDAISRS